MPPSHLRRVLKAPHRPCIDRAVVVVVVDLPSVVHLALVVMLDQPTAVGVPVAVERVCRFQAAGKEGVSSSTSTKTFDSSEGPRFVMGGSANTT
jgi:hypothetical protein